MREEGTGRSSAPGATAPPPDDTGSGNRCALMLGGGGARAAYQVGVLSYIGRRLPNLRFPILTGVSAGAINIGFLASFCGNFGEAIALLRRKWCSLTTEEIFRSDPWSLFWIAARWGVALLSGGAPLVPRARSLVDTEPLRGFLRRSIDTTGIVANLREGAFRAVAISALSYQTGRTVTFVQGRGPLDLWTRTQHRATRARIGVDHILASAAIPILFPAVKLGQQWYGDGSFRYTAPLSPAIHLGADRILAISARYGRSPREAAQPGVLHYPPPAQILGLIFNSVFLDTLDDDAARLRRINHLLAKLPEEERRNTALRPIELLILRPSKDLGRLAGEYEIRLPRTLRFFMRGLGTPGVRSGDFLSYLLFESPYVTRLIQLGEQDAEAQWSTIQAFLEAAPAPAGALEPTA